MFNSKREMGEVKEEIVKLNYSISTINNSIEELERVEPKFDKFKDRLELDIEKKMIEFRKEVISEICNKFFDTLDKIFRTNKEISLISSLAHQVNDKDMTNLKSQLLQPFLEARWSEDNKKKGNDIVNKGVKIIERRKELYDEIIEKERKGEKVEKLKIRLETYDEVIGDLK